MKQSLQLKMGQQLAMTPQLQQAMLLQMSTVELQQEIQTALDENPLLELAEDDLSTDAPEIQPTHHPRLNRLTPVIPNWVHCWNNMNLVITPAWTVAEKTPSSIRIQQ